MKFLLIILGVIFLLVIAYLSIGVISPEVKYATTLEIDKPIEETFALLMDESLMKKWLPGFQKMEIVEEKPGKVGSTYLLHFRVKGRTIPVIEEITAYEPNRRFAFNLVHAIASAHVEIRFTENGESTGITASTSVSGNSLLWKPLLPLFKSNLNDQNRAAYLKLEKALEAASTKF